MLIYSRASGYKCLPVQTNREAVGVDQREAVGRLQLLQRNL